MQPLQIKHISKLGYNQKILNLLSDEDINFINEISISYNAIEIWFDVRYIIDELIKRK